ncbi:hypothetical protein I5907_15565 [Panacibacter sp. DH6]|uniref:Uncharacterized protein n=1 Tax=Panacibacter microcysteis TaxID=2793269 RepID=A0A931E962_9BACT|nr:hypothetical protein [Panacibacter microcysteis]MBG9377661.1 hypothetical protein [Panacibacter microcysteis]
MKTKLIQRLGSVIPAAIVFVCFTIFSSLEKDKKAAAASDCASGYTMTNANLKKFMLDSLRGISFEGGVYAKADLLAAINSLSTRDDSVYLVNVLVNCTESNGTDLVLTSRNTDGVMYARAKRICNCPPPKPCCRNTACVAKIKRSCITYQPYPTIAVGAAGTAITYANE